LVLGSTPTHQAVVRDLNATLFHRLAQVILEQPEARTINPNPQTWVVIDELTYAGHLPNLQEILATSRSKGGCFVLGFQHIGPLKQIYGEATKSIFSHCQNRAFLRVTDSETQKFVAEDIGNYEAELPHHGSSQGTTTNFQADAFGSHYSGHSISSGTSVQYQRHKLPRIMPEEFRHRLLFAHEKLRAGIPAFLVTPLLDAATFVTIPPEFLDVVRVVPDKKTEAREKNEGKELEKWTPEELARLDPPPQQKDAAPAPAPTPAATPPPPQPNWDKLPRRKDIFPGSGH
jgi:hypothetical protein